MLIIILLFQFAGLSSSNILDCKRTNSIVTHFSLLSFYWYLDYKFSSFTFFRCYSNLTSMPLSYDIVTHTQSQTGSLPAWLGSEERLKNLILYFFRDATAIVFHPDLNLSIQSFGSDGNIWMVII